MNILTVQDYAVLSVIGPQKARFLNRPQNEQSEKLESLSPFGRSVAIQLIHPEENKGVEKEVEQAAQQVMRLSKMQQGLPA